MLFHVALIPHTESVTVVSGFSSNSP